MAHGGNVLNMLAPLTNFTIEGDDYDSIVWLDGTPLVTQADFEAGFAQYDTLKAEQDAKAVADKAALLAKLGITEAEARLLIGGN